MNLPGPGVDASFDVVAIEDLQSAFMHAPIGIAVLTPTGVITAVNRQLKHLVQRASHELIHRTFFDVCHPDDLALARTNCDLMTRGQRSIIRHECRFLRPDGEPIWVLVSTSRVAETDGRDSHLIMHIEDITDRKLLEQQLLHQALHDPLTGLANRTLLRTQIDDVQASSSSAVEDSLLLLDLDRFKSVNDSHGHLIGDQVLQEFARRVSRLVRPTDLAVRIGGDEFAVWCPGTSRAEAEDIAERLRNAALVPFEVDGHLIELAASVGISARPHIGMHVVPGDALTRLVREADRSMYAEKRRTIDDNDASAAPRGPAEPDTEGADPT